MAWPPDPDVCLAFLRLIANRSNSFLHKFPAIPKWPNGKWTTGGPSRPGLAWLDLGSLNAIEDNKLHKWSPHMHTLQMRPPPLPLPHPLPCLAVPPPPAVLILIGRHNCSAPLPIIIDQARKVEVLVVACPLSLVIGQNENEFRANLHKASNSSSPIVPLPVVASVVVPCPSGGNWNLCKFGKRCCCRRHQCNWEEWIACGRGSIITGCMHPCTLLHREGIRIR